jgi:hypothetical protein
MFAAISLLQFKFIYFLLDSLDCGILFIWSNNDALNDLYMVLKALTAP